MMSDEPGRQASLIMAGRAFHWGVPRRQPHRRQA